MPLSRLTWLAVATITVADTSAVPLNGQGFDIGLTELQCESIRDNSLNNPARMDTLFLTRNCPGVWNDVIAELLGRSSLATSDFVTYGRVAQLAGLYREDPVAAAATAIAENGSNPDITRIAALRVLQSFLSVDGIDADLARWVNRTGHAGPCIALAGYARGIGDGEVPIPPSRWPEVQAAMKSIQTGTASNNVKFLASCVETTIAAGAVISRQDFTSFNHVTDFEWVKQCGREFLLRNRSTAWVTILLRWGSPQESKYWGMPPRPKGASYSEHTWTVPGNGSTALVIFQPNPANSYLLMNETVNNTPC